MDNCDQKVRALIEQLQLEDLAHQIPKLTNELGNRLFFRSTRGRFIQRFFSFRCASPTSSQYLCISHFIRIE